MAAQARSQRGERGYSGTCHMVRYPAGGIQEKRRTLIAKLSVLPVAEEDDRKLLYRHGIYAFERMRIRESTDELIASVHDVDKLLVVLADRDAWEASLYRDIVKSRLDAIKNFQGLVDDDDKERALQEYQLDHLWLLDPAWEWATNSESMGSRLAKESVITDDLSKKEKLGRGDIACRTNAGKHNILPSLPMPDRQVVTDSSGKFLVVPGHRFDTSDNRHDLVNRIRSRPYRDGIAGQAARAIRIRHDRGKPKRTKRGDSQRSHGQIGEPESRRGGSNHGLFSVHAPSRQNVGRKVGANSGFCKDAGSRNRALAREEPVPDQKTRTGMVARDFRFTSAWENG